MNIFRRQFILASGIVAAALFVGCEKAPDTAPDGRPILRVGFFPNITHAPALVGYHETATKGAAGWFEKRTGAKIEWYPFNAGPSAIEALFTGAIDATYVGPSPVINGYTRSKATDIRVLTGAARGGAALVVRKDSPLKSAANFRGRKIGTPQLGGTQDVTARAWLVGGGLTITQRGGDAFVIPTPNPDQLDLFRRGALDAVWTVEPWVSRLELEAKGKVYLDESALWPETGGKYVTTHLVSSARFLTERPELLKKWIAAQVELTRWANTNANEAKRILNAELKAETTRALPQATLDRAWPRLELTHDPVRASLLKSAENAHRIGFLREKPDLSRIYDLHLLNEVLREAKLPEAH